MRQRWLLIMLLVAGAPVSFARSEGQGKKEEKSTTEKGYTTPEEVFKATTEAAKSGDFKLYVAGHTSAWQQKTAVDCAVDALNERRRDKRQTNPKIRERTKPILDVLDRHGLTTKATEKIDFASEPEDEKAKEKVKRALLALIKDPAAFIADLRATERKAGRLPPVRQPNRLTDVKIDGRKAKGRLLVTVSQESEVSFDVDFVKVEDSWKIDGIKRAAE